MKTARILTVALLLAVLTLGCTQDNGYIGRIFGSWRLTSMTLDGEPVAAPAGSETFWSFQGKIVMVTLQTEAHEYTKQYGTFERMDGNILRVDFSHHSDDVAPGTGGYAAPQWMGFPASGIFDLREAKNGKSGLVLTWTAPEGVYIYKFTKTW